MEKSSRRRGKRMLDAEQIAACTQETVNKIKKLHPRDRLRPGTKYTFHDMNSVGYGWLLPGWVAEERRVLSGRIYRYYYDPNGRFYDTQHKVIQTLGKLGLVIIDK